MTEISSVIFSSCRKSAWAPIAVFLFYVIAAKGFNAYIIFPRFDIPTHFFGGLAICYFYLVNIFYFQKLTGDVPQLIQLISAVGLTAISAVVWEFLEYGSDYFFVTKMNLGVADTLADLFFGLLGAFILVLIFVFTKKPVINADLKNF